MQAFFFSSQGHCFYFKLWYFKYYVYIISFPVLHSHFLCLWSLDHIIVVDEQLNMYTCLTADTSCELKSTPAPRMEFMMDSFQDACLDCV